MEQLRCNDSQWRQGKDFYERGFAQLTEAEQKQSHVGQYMNCAYWRADTLMPDIVDSESYPETIVVESEFDRATAWEIGRKSGPKLPSTSFIAIDNESKHGIFPYGTHEVDALIIDFFLHGKRPKNITITQAKPMWNEEITYEGWTPLYKGAKHVGEPNTDPWRVAGGGVATPYPVKVTGADIVAPGMEQQAFHQWVEQTYGQDGLDVLREAQESVGGTSRSRASTGPSRHTRNTP